MGTLVEKNALTPTTGSHQQRSTVVLRLVPVSRSPLERAFVYECGPGGCQGGSVLLSGVEELIRGLENGRRCLFGFYLKTCVLIRCGDASRRGCEAVSGWQGGKGICYLR